VPPLFHEYATLEWQKLGSPVSSVYTVWDIFANLKQAFIAFVPDPSHDLQLVVTLAREPGWDGGETDEIEPFPNQAQPGLNAGISSLPIRSTEVVLIREETDDGVIERWADDDERIFANFTDEEAEDEDLGIDTPTE
jgi:hypothetical protein